MNFETVRVPFEKHFNEMSEKYPVLYQTDTPKDDLWELYLESIPEEENQVFRTRREYDCSTCRHTIKQIGGLVGIKDQKIETIWDFETDDPAWNKVVKTLSDFVKSHKVSDRFLSKFKNIGDRWTYDPKNDIRWSHFSAVLPDKYLNHGYDTVDTAIGRYRDARNVFKRSLDEITLDSVDTILELINQNSLYKGTEYKAVLVSFRACLLEYEKLTEDQKELYAWENANESSPVSRIRNTAIGTLLVDVSSGMDLDEAVRRYESITAPENYKRSKPIYTKKMLEDAEKTITQLGYLESLERRFATPDDITVNNILFSNRDTAKRIQGGESIFDQMKKDAAARATSDPKKFSKVEEVSIEDFIKNVLPTATDVEAYVEGRHTPNFVSLIAPIYPHSKGMFKWGNNFGWAYSGNVTDSILKTNVKNAGGKVDGVLRFSIQWNDQADYDGNDEDAHCVEPDGFEIYYAAKRDYHTGGNLDVDIICPVLGKAAVENITWPDIRRMRDGSYTFFVRCYSCRGGTSGFRAEIEFDGQIYTFDYSEPLRQGRNVVVAVVEKEGNRFSISPKLPYGSSSKDVWGIKTNTFVPVSVICYSPNYWDEQKGIGNKHYMFMLKGCVNPEGPAAWYNEFLNSDLYPEHRKVMEAMGFKARVKDAEDQLSGIGFSSTVRNDLVVKVKGMTERTMRIKF